MYEDYFQLDSRPFHAAPFTGHYFPARAISSMLAQAQQAVERGSGPVVVIGGAGCGKTLLLMKLAEQYHEHYQVINLGCARLDKRTDLLQNILFEVNRPYTGMSEGELRLALMDYLKPNDQCPNGILLLVDEAHQLDAGLMDEVCLLTNMVRDGQPRVRLVMAGKYPLEEALTSPKLDSFNQRIAARGYLTNLSCEETGEYIRKHVDRVNGRGNEIFPESTIRVIFEVTDGCPRLINQVCERSLIIASQKDQNLITEQCAQESWWAVQSIPGETTAQEVPHASPAESGNDESWTVLEFGPLEDEPEGHVDTSDFIEEFDQIEEVEDIARPLDAMGIEGAVDLTAMALAANGFAAEVYEEPDNFVSDELPSMKMENSSELADTSDFGASSVKGAVTAGPDFADVSNELEHVETGCGLEDGNQKSGEGNEIESSEPVLEVPRFIPELDSPSEAVDPFAETFEEEELLMDRYLPFVAEQNRSSLTVTATDLESIRPPQSISFAELHADLLGGEAESENRGAAEDEQQEQIYAPEESPGRQEALTVRMSEDTVGFEDWNSALETEDVENPTTETESANEFSRIQPNAEFGAYWVEENTESGDPAESSFLQNTYEVRAASSSDSDVSTSDYEEAISVSNFQDNVVDDEVVKRRADEILNDLASLDLTGMENGGFTVEYDNTIDEPANVVPFGESFDQGENVTPQMDDQQAVGMVQEDCEAQDVTDEGNMESQECMAIEYPIAQHDSYQKGGNEIPQDDRDMITVSRANQLNTPDVQDDIPAHLMPEHPSKGRAERLDYKQLFDQLRNIGNNQ